MGLVVCMAKTRLWIKEFVARRRLATWGNEGLPWRGAVSAVELEDTLQLSGSGRAVFTER